LAFDPLSFFPMHLSSHLMSAPLLYEVRESEIHNTGIFAAADMEPNTQIVEYVGEKITKKESARRGIELMEKAKETGDAAVYIFTLNSRYDLDGAKGENPARYINHSCDPNCEAFIERGRIFIYSKKAIKKGDELTYNYGFDLDTWEDHPCLCGSENCVGFIVDESHWPKLRRILKRHAASRQKWLEGEAAKASEATNPVKAVKKARKAAKI
jgi:SET domain-containing protein